MDTRIAIKRKWKVLYVPVGERGRIHAGSSGKSNVCERRRVVYSSAKFAGTNLQHCDYSNA